MKKLVLVIALIGLGLFANAQGKLKIGHINSNDLLLLMPERDSAEKKMTAYAKQLELQLTTMSSEYEKKLTNYEQNKANMTDLIRQDKEGELMNLQRRIQDFQTKAQESLQQREQELMKPLIDSANKAIKAVADEQGYTYVFDSSVGVMLHFPDGDDILPAVKKKLNIE